MSDDEQRFGRREYDQLARVVQGLVTRDATTALQVGNLVTMFAEHRAESRTFMGDTRDTLAEISKQTTETNGRVNGHDDHFGVNDREIRDIKATLDKAIWWVVGLNGGVLVGVVVYWVTHK